MARQNFEFLYRQVAELISSDIPIQDVISLLLEDQYSLEIRSILLTFQKYVYAGFPVEVAIQKSGLVNSPLYLGLIEIGEKTGTLGKSFQYIASMEEEWSNLRTQLIQSLSYPVMVVGIAIIAILILMIFVVPTFKDAFSSFNMELPWITSFLFSTYEIISTHLTGILILTVILGIGLYLVNRFLISPSAKQKLLLKLPVISEILLLYYNYNLTVGLSILLKQGISLLESIQLMANQYNKNLLIKTELSHMIKRMLAGQSFSSILPQTSIFLPVTRQMLRVGEENANMGHLLEKASGVIKFRLESRLKLLTTFIEPLLIITLGVVVAVILISMYIPLFDSMVNMGGF